MTESKIKRTGDGISKESRSTLVFGASVKPERTSYTAMNMLREAGHPVFAIGGREGKVGDVQIHKWAEGMEIPKIHTVTLYMNATRQAQYQDFILSLNPARIIFNPGAENVVLQGLAESNGIETLNACTLVLISYKWF